MRRFKLMPLFTAVLNGLSILSWQRKASMMKVRAAKAYVAGVRKTRAVAAAVVLTLVALVLLAQGLSLLHAALFTYSDWPAATKCGAALALAALEIGAAAAFVAWLLREKTWVRFTGIAEVLKSVIPDKAEERDGRRF